MRPILEESRFRVLVANRLKLDGDDLLAFVGEHAPNLVIHDITWPYDERLSSFQALRTAQTGPQTITWMAITTSDRVVEVLGEAGVPVIAKPFELETFVETVASLALRGTSKATPS